MKPRKVCVLASGGLDSSMLMAELLAAGWEVHPVYVRSGLRWEKAEQAWLRRLLRRLRSPRLAPLETIESPLAGLPPGHWSRGGKTVPGAGEDWSSVYLPGRNLVLLSQASLFCRLRGLPRVAMATLKGNPFADATPRFRRALARTAAIALGETVRLTAPYARLTKEEVRRRVPGFPAELVFSCLKPRGLSPCGACGKCEEAGNLAPSRRRT